jgi:hypothetical protein
MNYLFLLTKYIMIYSLLYSSKLFNENKYRNTIIYTIGTIFYTIIHWLLFSSIGNNNVYIQKYRYALYFLVAGDLIYVGSKYKESWTSANIVKPVTQPIIEKIGKNVECIDGKCVLKKPIHKKELEPKGENKNVEEKSDVSLPVYKNNSIKPEDQNSIYLPTYENKPNEMENYVNQQVVRKMDEDTKRKIMIQQQLMKKKQMEKEEDDEDVEEDDEDDVEDEEDDNKDDNYCDEEDEVEEEDDKEEEIVDDTDEENTDKKSDENEKDEKKEKNMNKTIEKKGK